MFPAPKEVSSDLRSTDGLTVLARIEIVVILETTVFNVASLMEFYVMRSTRA